MLDTTYRIHACQIICPLETSPILHLRTVPGLQWVFVNVSQAPHSYPVTTSVRRNATLFHHTTQHCFLWYRRPVVCVNQCVYLWSERTQPL
jgi:hypothetical protein